RHATLFVTNVLNGTVAVNGATVHRGTVVRIGLSLTGTQPRVAGERVIGSDSPPTATRPRSSSARPAWASRGEAPSTSQTARPTGSRRSRTRSRAWAVPGWA